MPVPSYNVITDAEMAIGKPMTSSLATRLRDNFCAFFGIDPSDPTPEFVIAPSVMPGTQIDLGFSVTDNSNGTVTGTERIIDVITDDISDVVIESGRIYRASPWVLLAEVQYIEVTYSAGSPTGCIVTTQQLSDNGGAATPYAPTRTAIVDDNAWYTLFTTTSFASNFSLEGRCRSDGTNVYLTLRWNYPSGQTRHNGTITAECRSFRAKSA